MIQFRIYLWSAALKYFLAAIRLADKVNGIRRALSLYLDVLLSRQTNRKAKL